MENPRVPETIPSPSVDPLPIPSTISQIDLLKIMSQQQEAAERQQQQLLQLLLDQQEQRKREQEQQLEQRKREQEQQLEQRRREQEQQLEQRRLDREAQERSETSLHELFRTTVAALQAVHQVNGSGEPAVTPRGSRVVTPLLSPVPSPVPVSAVRQVRHPGRIQDVRDSSFCEHFFRFFDTALSFQSSPIPEDDWWFYFEEGRRNNSDKIVSFLLNTYSIYFIQVFSQIHSVNLNCYTTTHICPPNSRVCCLRRSSRFSHPPISLFPMKRSLFSSYLALELSVPVSMFSSEPVSEGSFMKKIEFLPDINLGRCG
ncbi:uncharacterized protein [Neodiprion pinetum]|uniref:uncharacterized protein n=1 Tax=Neodiprion pinetum TaxID=441929 RepID=UPI00372401CA